jgi:hypothetical protein
VGCIEQAEGRDCEAINDASRGQPLFLLHAVRTKKASLEGMSEAFGPSAEADCQEDAAREAGRPQFLGRVYAQARESGQTRSRKASYAFLDFAVEAAAKKRGSIRRWSPMKVVANGRGRRKRRLPVDPAEGGGSA